MVTYGDTDSCLIFCADPEAKDVQDICQISERLGCLKIEKDGIKKFFSTAAKTYSIETLDGNITIKAKGFNLLEKLLKDNKEACLLEKNITNTFMGIELLDLKKKSAANVFQKQIKVNPLEMVPALVPKSKSYKLLNFIGPRRQIDLTNWLTFRFERLAVDTFETISINPKETKKNNAAASAGYTYNCVKNIDGTFEIMEAAEADEQKTYKVCLVPNVKGLLPALPYGYDMECAPRQFLVYKLIL